MFWRLPFGYFFILSLIHIPFHTSSQSYNYRHYTVDAGLISSTVYNVFQDSKGFIWFCTDAGVNRFNGKVFEKFSQDEGLSDNEVFRMYEDKKGRTWFLTYNGKPTYFDGKKFHTPANDSLLEQLVVPSGFYNVFEDSKGRLFFSPFHGRITLLEGEQVSPVSFYNVNGESISPLGILEIFENNNNELVAFSPLITSSSCPLFSGHYDFKYSIFNGNQYRFIKPGEAFFLSREGVVHINRDKEERIISVDRLKTLMYDRSKLFIDHKQNIWVTGGEGGIMKFNSATNYKGASELFLGEKIISSVYQDNSMNYWFTTLGDGVFFLPFDYDRFLNYSISEGLVSNDVTALNIDYSGNIWIGFSNGALNKLTSEGKIERINLSFSNNRYCRIRKIEADEKNNIWIASDDNISFIPAAGVLPIRIENPVDCDRWKYLSLNNKTRQHALAGMGGIFRLQQKTDLKWQITRDESFSIKRTFTIFHDNSGGIYFGDVNGLNYFDGKRLDSFPSQNGLLKQRINHISGMDSVLVVATDGHGIYLFKDGEILSHINTGNGLPSGICRRIFVDRQNVWVATNRGLAKIVFSGYDKYSVKIFNRGDFLLSDDIRDVVVNNSKVYMATDKGLCIMDDDNTFHKEKLLPVYFTSFQAGQQTFSPDSDIALHHSQDAVLIRFIALDYENPDHVLYRYRFRGESRDWVTTISNQIEFLHISPGTYDFELSAADHGKKWSDPVTLSFTVLPAWWQALWFKIMAAVILIASSFAVIRKFFIYRLRRQHEEFARQHAIEQERNRISSDIHDDLGSGLTQIAILSEIAKTDIKVSEQTHSVLQKVSSISDEMVNKISEIIWAINPSNDTLKNLIAYIHEFAGNYLEESTVRLQVNIPERIPDVTVSSTFRRHVFLIVKEALQNVMKHAKAKQVNIAIQVIPGQLIITIRDDGTGFDTSLHKSETGNGHGMKNIRHRAGLLGAELKIKSLNGAGTEIVFSSGYSAE